MTSNAISTNNAVVSSKLVNYETMTDEEFSMVYESGIWGLD